MQLPLFLLLYLPTAFSCIDPSIGRALYAIGFNAEGARFAGIPVRKRLALALCYLA